MKIVSLQSINNFEKYYSVISYKNASAFLSSICVKKYDEDSPSILNKTIYLITGGIAAGKSTVLYNLIKYFELYDIPFVGTDAFYNAYFSDLYETFEYGYNKAREYTDALLSSYSLRGQSFIWETVLSKQKKIDFIKACSELGYRIICFFVGTENSEITINRAKKRCKEGDHDVSKDFINDRYLKTLRMLSTAKQYFNVFVAFDNTERFKLIYYQDKDQTYKSDKIPYWFKRGYYE